MKSSTHNPDWASKKVEKFECGPCRGRVHADEVARLLRNEHQRAVRVVEKRIKELHEYHEHSSVKKDRAHIQCVIAEIEAVLHKLKEGRT